MRDYQNRITEVGILEASKRITLPPDDWKYDILLENTPARNQYMTGRCWIDAGLDLIEFTVRRKAATDSRLSSAFVAYHDLLLKTKCCLRFYLNTANIPAENRLMSMMLSKPVSDAGQWKILELLLKEHGAIPESNMPRSSVNRDTRVMIAGLNQKLRQCAYRIREQGERDLDSMWAETKGIIEKCIGAPPKTFRYNGQSYTPRTFYEKYYGGFFERDTVSLINIPTHDTPYYREYKVKWLYSDSEYGSVIGHYNVPMDYIREAVLNQLRAGIPIWFGADADHFSDKERGIFTRKLYDFERVFGTDFDIPKGEALTYRDSLISHAMLIWGVGTDNARTTRYCVKNSFGSGIGRDGYCNMTADWFDRYVYQAVIEKRFLPDGGDCLKNAETKWREAWDVIGCLAE